MKQPDYYVKIQDQEHGPLKLLEIQNLLKDQIISTKTLIRKSDSGTFVCLESFLTEDASSGLLKFFSNRNIIIFTVIALFFYLQYNINEANDKINALRYKIAAENNEASLLGKSLSEVYEMVEENKSTQKSIVERLEKSENITMQATNDYKLIKSTKNSIEALNNTVLQLKSASEANNKLQIDAFKDQVLEIQSNLDALTKEFNQIFTENQKLSKDLQILQRNSAALAVCEKDVRELNKKVVEAENFNKLVVQDLNNHQAKLKSHEDWLKSVNKR
jgi:hypothetical protein